MKTDCGDWHRSWGFSTTRIGKLETEDGKEFTWSGHCQGRHGQRWNKNQRVIFKSDGENIYDIQEMTDGSRLPDNRDVLKSVNFLISKL